MASIVFLRRKECVEERVERSLKSEGVAEVEVERNER